ncbi:hypothetical protein [Selenomonas ruminantium]|uniref:Uncharacterized protein n=1 Tax=Selenomonas ruminantium TaxID=971 RepID=A0A1I0YD98_SELRU|nr:hypothetical protein [Selenomonas ruminantium]SFB10173.1 hypothetical protein SAMN05216587_11140 [Selenomonas ruminantium]
MELLETLQEICNGTNWEPEHEDGNTYGFRWTGGDYDGYIILSGDTISDLEDDAYVAYENFDVDEETALWIGEDGHGKNGAPYRIRDILEEFENYEKDLENLWDNLRRARQREEGMAQW